MDKFSRIIYFVFIASVFVLFSACNEASTYSLKQENSKVDSLMALYQQTLTQNPAETKQLLFEVRQSVNDSINYYKLSALLGICYYLANDIDSAIIVNKSIVSFCGRQSKTNFRLYETDAKAYNDMSIFFQTIGHKDSAIICLEKAITAIYKTENLNSLPDIYMNLADNYMQNGDFPMATGQYRKALFISDSLNLGYKYNNAIYAGLGRIYTDLKNFELANSYYNKVESVLDTIPVYDQYFFSNSRGNYYYFTNEYNKALPWFRKAYKLSKMFEQRSYEATVEANLAEIYLLIDKPDSAKYYLDKSAEYFLKDNVYPATTYYLNGLYAAYYLHTAQLNKADGILSDSYDKDQVNPIYIYSNDKRLEDLYIRKGDYKKAYGAAKRIQLFDDSLRNISIQNNIAEIDSRYRQDTILLNQKVIIAQKEQKVSELSRINLIAIFSLFTLILIIIFVYIYMRRRRELQYAKQMATITSLRMENVRNRISPHFMFNVLNSLMPHLYEHEKLTIPFENLIQSIKGNLLISDKIAITLEEEISIVKNYLDLLKSIGEFIPHIEWKIGKDVDLKTFLPSMIIQIPVENAIKYAFEDYNPGNLVTITINNNDDKLYIEIEDNGIGFDPGRHSNSSKGTGNGLKILYKTIEILNIRNNKKLEFNIENEMEISSGKHGTKVSVKIPMNYRYDL